MRPISPSSSVQAIRLQPFRGRLLCRLSLRPSDIADPDHDREVVIVAGWSAPRLRHLIVYRQPVPDDPPRAA